MYNAQKQKEMLKDENLSLKSLPAEHDVSFVSHQFRWNVRVFDSSLIRRSVPDPRIEPDRNRFRSKLQKSSGVDGNGSRENENDVKSGARFVLQRTTNGQISENLSKKEKKSFCYLSFIFKESLKFNFFFAFDPNVFCHVFFINKSNQEYICVNVRDSLLSYL